MRFKIDRFVISAIDFHFETVCSIPVRENTVLFIVFTIMSGIFAWLPTSVTDRLNASSRGSHFHLKSLYTIQSLVSRILTEVFLTKFLKI